jgi:hypothetical protein
MHGSSLRFLRRKNRRKRGIFLERLPSIGRDLSTRNLPSKNFSDSEPRNFRNSLQRSGPGLPAPGRFLAALQSLPPAVVAGGLQPDNPFTLLAAGPGRPHISRARRFSLFGDEP